MWFAWSLVATAAEPVFTDTDTGAISGRITIAATPEAARALVSDPDALVAVVGGATVQWTRDAECLLVTTHAPHPIAPVTYVARTCPTAEGVHTSLVQSDDLSRFTADWRARTVEGATELSYTLDVAPSFPLPAFVARAATRKAVGESLRALEAHFAGSRPVE